MAPCRNAETSMGLTDATLPTRPEPLFYFGR
jgi:hypothetical protein